MCTLLGIYKLYPWFLKLLNFHFNGQSSNKNIILKRATDVNKNDYEQITNGYIHSNYFRAGREEI
jgi:hypothetical protein